MSDSENEDGVCKSACCANHICAKQIDTASEKHALCPLCLEATYCSEQCRVVDWVAHECPNIVAVNKIDKLVAMPYFYEDLAPAEAMVDMTKPDSVLNQQFLLLHTGADMVHTQRLVVVGERSTPYTVSKSKTDLNSGLGRGSEPADNLKNRKYTVSVKDAYGKSNATFSGTVGVDSIWLRNTQNSRAHKIAKIPGGKATGNVIFWPQPEFAFGQKLFPRNGSDLAVELKVAGLDPISVEFEYTAFKPLKWHQRFSRSFSKYLELRLRAKFGSSRENNVKNMQILKATTRSGTQVNLIFAVNPRQEDEVELLDVEVLVPTNKLNITGPPTKSAEEEELLKRTLSGLDDVDQKIAFRCDPRNVNQMVGLTMALELALQTSAAADMAATDLKNFQNSAGIIRKYTRSMLDKNGEAPEEIPMEVNTAIYTAVNALHDQNIGLSFKHKPALDNSYYELHKNDSIASIRAEVASLQLGTPEGSKFAAKAKRFLKGARGKEKGRLRAIQKIISDRLSGLERQFGEVAAADNASYKAWQQLGTEVAQKLNQQ